MTMDISNQNKLSEFYEELKRLNINVVRPDINECYADFKTEDDKFYYALGGIKAVGSEAISNIVKERLTNGKFSSINDFIKRVNPKDINKLQLEGLVKAGAFDKLNNNRQSIYNSIPNIITKSKNDFDNKSANQIDLFNEDEENEINIIEDTKDWEFEERLSKEFEGIGFFMSDHPLNQYKEIFEDYKIIDYQKFYSDDKIKESNIAATLLKIQERKTAKGNSYAVLKLTDLSSVFELFIFSDLLELNRDTLKEGSSLILTLTKTISSDEDKTKRINVRKIASLKELFNSPIKEITINLSSKSQLKELQNFFNEKGETLVHINFSKGAKIHKFKLKSLRNVDRKSINILRNKEISLNID
jgi:DNA polymerase-3 subunit alpha